MIKKIDDFLNKITMYRVVLYGLLLIDLAAIILSLFHILPYSPLAILFSTLFITTICLAVNMIFAWAYNAPTNTESVYITGIILALIITPISNPNDLQFFSIAIWASVIAMASKYLLAINKKHVFNPVAISVAITALALNQSASWWVGTSSLSIFVLIVGLLIIRKIHRFDFFISFIITTVIVSLNFHTVVISDIFSNLWRLLANTSVLFFATVMLTEPLTTPPTKILRICYGILVGFLFSPSAHIGSIYFTPELALIAGNIFVYIVSSKQKLLLKLKNVIQLSDDTFDFIFSPDEKLNFKPGQYLEWTLDRGNADSRGNRRYFTISSSPTEKNIAMGVKFYPKSSTFKRHLLEMNQDDVLVASQLAGDFVLPRNVNKKLVFIAGGIGITPFRSMIKYLVDTKQKRDIVLFYSNKTATDIVYEEIFDAAKLQFGMKTLYNLTDRNSSGYTGQVTDKMIKSEVPDYLDRYFYISGPRSMVLSFMNTLEKLNVKKSHIKTDFFPGFA